MHPSVAQGVAARHSDVKNATSSVRRENYLFLTFYQPYGYISTFFTGKKKNVRNNNNRFRLVK